MVEDDDKSSGFGEGSMSIKMFWVVGKGVEGIRDGFPHSCVLKGQLGGMVFEFWMDYKKYNESLGENMTVVFVFVFCFFFKVKQ